MPQVKWSDQARERLRSERKRRSLTLDQLSEQVGCSIAMLSMIEAGSRDPGEELTERLCKVLGLRLVVEQVRLVRAR